MLLPQIYQSQLTAEGLREDDNPWKFLGFKLWVAKISVAVTYSAVGSVKDSTSEVGGVTHHPGHILRKICIKVWTTGPESEPSLDGWLCLVWSVMFIWVWRWSFMVHISHSVVTLSHHTFWKNKIQESFTKYFLSL